MKMYQRLGDLRKAKGLSQADLAEALKVSRQTISKWETGVTVPTTENLTYLSRVLGVSMDELVHGGKTVAEAEDTVPEGGPAPLGELPEQARRFAGKKWVVLAVCLLLVVLLGTYLGWRRWHQNSNLLENAEIQKEVEVDPNQSFSIQPIEPEGR